MPHLHFLTFLNEVPCCILSPRAHPGHLCYDYIETDPAAEPSAKAGSVSHSSIVQALGLFFPNKQDCKPGSVLDGHLSSPAVTDGLKRPTRKQTGRLMLSVRSCFEWGLHMPLLLPGGR